MIIAIAGGSCTGKDTLARILSEEYGYRKVISHTTRKSRLGEVYGKEYYFVDPVEFASLEVLGCFVESDEYQGERKYGSTQEEYEHEKVVAVLTPNGCRKVKEKYGDKVLIVYLEADLGTRIKRYVNRIEKGNGLFSMDDARELFERIHRDEGMFTGFKKYHGGLAFENNEGSRIESIADVVMDYVRARDEEE